MGTCEIPTPWIINHMYSHSGFLCNSCSENITLFSVLFCFLHRVFVPQLAWPQTLYVTKAGFKLKILLLAYGLRTEMTYMHYYSRLQPSPFETGSRVAAGLLSSGDSCLSFQPLEL